MFSLFGKSTKATAYDKVWMTRLACRKGMMQEGVVTMRESQVSLFFFFFEEDLLQFTELLSTSGITWITLVRGFNEELANGNIYVADAFSVGNPGIKEWLSRHVQFFKKLFVYGHYPTLGPEEEFIQTLNQILPGTQLHYGMSLEDALLVNFGADKIKPVMDVMGVKPDEHIDHPLVAKAILNARKKLSDQGVGEIRTKSQSDWFIKNVRSGF